MPAHVKFEECVVVDVLSVAEGHSLALGLVDHNGFYVLFAAFGISFVITDMTSALQQDDDDDNATTSSDRNLFEHVHG